ncbi:MAG: hypothetical protein KTR33_12975 [Gammaproteobacteria bacterium]|nr:hypothetical protein [Gammaproteobacteria bacterium]
MSLDSLTDLVSNAVGVLILLLLITALQSNKPFNDTPLPIEHQSGLVPQFFYVHEQHLQAIDVNSVFTNGLLAASEFGTDVEYQISADFTGRPDDELTLAILPIDTDSWPVFNDLNNLDTPLRKFIDNLNTSQEFAFVFVHDHGDGKSFAQFESVKQWFLDNGIAVGWLPVTTDNPAYLCSWSDVSACRYSPSWYANPPS